MAIDFYIYNATNLTLDTTATMAELVARSGKLVPPGSQAHIVYNDVPSYNAAVVHAVNAGSKDVSTIASLNTYSGISHGQNPHVVNGKQAPIV